MTSLAKNINSLIVNVSFTDKSLHVILADGREIYAPLTWFPRLQTADNQQRQHWRLIGGGIGVHWEDVDEDISLESLLTTTHHAVER